MGFYYATNSTGPTFTASTGALQFALGSPAGSDGAHVFKQFTQTQLAVGETITAQVTFTAFANVPDGNNFLRVGLFDTSNTCTANQATARAWTTTPNEGYWAGIGGSANTNLAEIRYTQDRTLPITAGAGSTALTTGTVNIALHGATPVTLTLSIERSTSSTLLLNASFGTFSYAQQTITSPTSYADTFDTMIIGFTPAEVGRGFTIDDVSVEVIPEPSIVALLASAMGCLVFLRRRRSE